MIEYQLTNREKAREPRGRRFICAGCDRRLVSSGSKCQGCGAKDGIRYKKPTPT